MKSEQFIMIGLVVAILIGIIAVFVASGNPDGLESTALVVQDQKALLGDTPDDAEIHEEEEGRFAYESPFPDYTMGEDGGKMGELAVIVLGTIIALILAFAIGKVAMAKKS